MTAIEKPFAASLVLGILALATPPLSPAHAQPLTREEALHVIRNQADPAARRAAVRTLGDTGTSADQPVLVAALRDEDQLVRATAENSLWQVWSRSGDPEIDRLFAAGVAEMGSRMVRRAVETFSRIIERKPDFAEAWNKRATLYYWLGEFDRSLADCDEVIKRNPDHFGALSGYGMIYIQLDQLERALEYFQRALAVNPNLRGVQSAIEELERELRARGRETT